MANSYNWFLDVGKRRHCFPRRMIAFMFFGSIFGVQGSDYIREVKPILRDHCLRCHGPIKAKANLRLDTRTFALKGGKDGPALVVGNVEKSLLVKKITAEKEEDRMPPEGKPLSEKQIEILKNWIANGAKAPAGEKAYNPGNHWAFQVLKRPKIPAANAEWSRLSLIHI